MSGWRRCRRLHVIAVPTTMLDGEGVGTITSSSKPARSNSPQNSAAGHSVAWPTRRRLSWRRRFPSYGHRVTTPPRRRRGRAAVDAPRDGARQRGDGGRRRADPSAAASRISGRRSRPRCGRQAQPAILAPAAVRAHREPGTDGQLLAVCAGRAGPGSGASRRSHFVPGIVLGDLPLFSQSIASRERVTRAHPPHHRA